MGDRIYKLGSVMVFLSAFVLSSWFSFSNPPLNVDFYFHLIVAEVWAKGQIGMFCEFVMRQNHIPYPPVFHWLLVPSVWFGQAYNFGRLLQVVFYSGILVATMLFVKKYKGIKAAFFSGMLLLSNMAYTDAFTQARPQSLVMLLLPIALYFYLSEKRRGFIVSCILMIYTHGYAAFFLIYSLFISKLRDRTWLKAVLVFGFAFGVLLTSSVLYSGGAYDKWSAEFSDQSNFMVHNPVQFFIMYFGSLVLGFPILIQALFKWKRQTSYAKALCLVIVGSVALCWSPVWIIRWMMYVTVPLSCLMAEWLNRRTKLGLTLMLPVLLASLLLYQLNYFWVTATGNWSCPLTNPWS